MDTATEALWDVERFNRGGANVLYSRWFCSNRPWAASLHWRHEQFYFSGCIFSAVVGPAAAATALLPVCLFTKPCVYLPILPRACRTGYDRSVLPSNDEAKTVISTLPHFDTNANGNRLAGFDEAVVLLVNSNTRGVWQ
jgi:hypothetical protein